MLTTLALLTLFAADPRMIDSVEATGFEIYRSGRLSAAELERLCAAGLEEVIVLDGSGEARECRMRARLCPSLRVRLDVEQEADEPLTEEFLAAFDRWVAEASESGRKILFRCESGWHRSGRLAAYYRMKHQGLSAEKAIAEMHRVGRFMWRYPELEPQVQALADHIAGRPCSVEDSLCVSRTRARESLSSVVFRDDVCPE